MKNSAVSENSTNCYTKVITSQPSLWDEEVQDEDRQLELIATLSAFAVRYAYPELPTLVKAGRANWTPETWDLPRLEQVSHAADLFSRRWRAYFALTRWAIEHGHPSIVVGDQVIEAGLTSWVAWCKDASLEELSLVLEEVA